MEQVTGVEAAFGSSNILQRQRRRSVPCPRTGLILTCDGPSLTISWSLCAPTCTVMKVVHGAQGKSAREDGTRPCSDDLGSGARARHWTSLQGGPLSHRARVISH